MSKTDLEKEVKKTNVLSDKHIKIGFAHYFWDSSSRGVNTVVNNNLLGLKELYPNSEFVFIGESFKEGVFDGFEHRELPLAGNKDYFHLLGGLMDSMKDLDFVVFENPIRGINPYMTRAAKEFTQMYGKPVHWRNHDFIWDHDEDWDKFNLVFDNSKQAFPSSENFSCSVLTPPAKDRMKKYYDKEINVLRNSIVCDTFENENAEKDAALDDILVELGIVRPGQKKLVSGNRIVERKAVEHGYPIVKNLNELTGEDWAYITTESIDMEKKFKFKEENIYQRILESVSNNHDIGASLGEVSEVIDDINFNMGNLYRISDLAISPSIAEGFGYMNVESWVAGVPLIGRYISDVHPDFERHGMDFKHFYDDEVLRSRSNHIERLVDVDEILKDPKKYELFKDKMNLEWRMEHANKVLEQNKAAAKEHYNHLDSTKKLVGIMKMPGYEKLEEKV